MQRTGTSYNNIGLKTWLQLLSTLLFCAIFQVELARKFGYRADSYPVLTADGFTLGLHRVRSSRTRRGAPAVFVQHGIFCSSADWIVPGPGRALGSLTLSYLIFEHNKNKTPVLGNAIPVLGVKRKPGWYVFWLFFEIGLCSAISFKRSRRELSIDVAVVYIGLC